MAEGTVRIVSEQDRQSHNTTGESDEFELLTDNELRNLTSNRSSASNGTPSVTTAKQRRESKRTSLRATDRRHEGETVSETESEKRTTPPKSFKKTPTQTAKKYLADTEALQNARAYLALLEMTGVAIAGSNGEMTEFERTMMTPALKRSIARIPVEYLERGNIVFDTALLVGGLTMYFNRVSGGIKFPSRNQKKGVQEDKEAPVTQPMENIVVDVKPGDIDGIAVPVPEIVQRYMNGNV